MNHVHDLAKLEEILSRGLCSGAGDGVATFCAEQAVAVLCGLPVTDHPDECVTPAVSAFGRRLNDARWKDERTRADGMRNFLLAQIGSKGIVDGREFAARLAIQTIRRVLPLWLRHGKLDEKWIAACENASDLESAQKAAREARDAAYRLSSAAAVGAAYGAADAAADAYAAAYAAADAADAYAVGAAAYAVGAYAADAAAGVGVVGGVGGARVRAVALPLAAQIAVEVLCELKSPGCELLATRATEQAQ